ncbi:type II toxin-antitoxin system RelE/ParE family toxin [Butyrivibrio sp. AC2005]|uniref:type II toxin-antitoxin system RelE/ParE family toxin n=1 Tax=Butyrivibrio sp. AC2005 TaxID=1280672 RepID=UPI00042A7FF2|nr:type II toxin-antitoxin system RelE/ParE family toxin [Butyrivibrio sp. AC2005]
MPDSKSLGNGIFELRTIQGNNIARCLYFFTVGDKAIVTNGIIKKTPKTPPDVIELAESYREDYIRRFGDE